MRFHKEMHEARMRILAANMAANMAWQNSENFDLASNQNYDPVILSQAYFDLKFLAAPVAGRPPKTN